MNIRKILEAPALVFALAGLAPGHATAQSVEDFYSKQTVKMVVSSDVGGGYDAYTRLLARHLGGHIPGNPTIVVQNMPGAGGILAANFLYNVAPKDGSVIAMVHRGVPMVPLLGMEGAQFDPTNFNWIGSMNNEVSVCVSWHTAPQKSLQDVMTSELIIGGSGANDTEVFPAVMNNVLGTRFKIISGYPSGTAVGLAMERGEVNGRCGWSWSSVKTQHSEWLDQKKISLLMQMSLEKHPELPDVPLVMDLTDDEQKKQILELIFARQVMGRPVLMPPDVPADRVAAIRQAFDATMKDSAFLKEAEKQTMEITPVSGPGVEKLIRKIYATPKNVVAMAQSATEYRGEAVKAEIKLDEVAGKLTASEKGGRKLVFEINGGESVDVKVSGSRTAVTLDGKTVKRKVLKPGMGCNIAYSGPGSEAKSVDCRS